MRIDRGQVKDIHVLYLSNLWHAPTLSFGKKFSKSPSVDLNDFIIILPKYI